MGSDKIEYSPKNKIVIIIVSFIIFFIVLCVIYYVNTSKSNKTTVILDKSKVNQYIDPGSGEVVSDPPGKAKEKTDSSNSVVFLGFSNLLDHGITYKQFTKLKSHFKQYGAEKKITIKEVSMTVSSYKSNFDNKSGELIMNFEVTINRKDKYNAKVTYKDLAMPVLYLYDQKTNNLVFKSYTGGN